jgi:RimJ/RimL family protein N-acetyltransferase
MIAINDLKSKIAIIRLWIKPEAQQKGNSKKALLELISLYSCKRLVYTADVTNIASNKLAISCGFKFIRQLENDGEVVSEYIFN